MTSRDVLHAIIDALPVDALSEAEARLQPMEDAINSALANGTNVPAASQEDPTDNEPNWETMTDDEVIVAAAARGDALAWALLNAQPLGPEFNSEHPHDLAGRGDDWFADDGEE